MKDFAFLNNSSGQFPTKNHILDNYRLEVCYILFILYFKYLQMWCLLACACV